MEIDALEELDRVIRLRREHYRRAPWGDNAAMEDSHILDMIRALKNGRTIVRWEPTEE